MKRLILASILCLACAVALRAQDITIPAYKWHISPPKVIIPPGGMGHWRIVPQTVTIPREIRVIRGFTSVQSGVCSVPLLTARANAADPGIAFKPSDSAVPIRQAHLPAPPCK